MQINYTVPLNTSHSLYHFLSLTQTAIHQYPKIVLGQLKPYGPPLRDLLHQRALGHIRHDARQAHIALGTGVLIYSSAHIAVGSCVSPPDLLLLDRRITVVFVVGPDAAVQRVHPTVTITTKIRTALPQRFQQIAAARQTATMHIPILTTITTAAAPSRIGKVF